jgi:outer membrane protein TolC
VGRVNALDVLRARRSELNARNALLGEEERHLLALDRFRIFLGLPDSVRVQVRSEAPEFVPVDFDVQSAVAVALANRLDLLNRREQLEDEERGLRIARNDLLPRLDFDASIGVGGIGTSINDQTYDDDYSAGFTFELPLDRVREKNDLRSARIGLTRARRSYDEFLDNVVVEIESAFRELERRVDSLEIQRQLIADQQANVRIAQIRFERGEVSNRDKVEAEQSLLEAKNGLIREQVDYEIARLRLLRSLGILFIDDNGMWRE